MIINSLFNWSTQYEIKLIIIVLYIYISCLGKLTLGSSRDADISVVGTGVESIHCTIENNNGVVTLHPINGSTAVDGVPINSPVRLAQGKTLTHIRMAKYKPFL